MEDVLDFSEGIVLRTGPNILANSCFVFAVVRLFFLLWTDPVRGISPRLCDCLPLTRLLVPVLEA